MLSHSNMPFDQKPFGWRMLHQNRLVCVPNNVVIIVPAEPQSIVFDQNEWNHFFLKAWLWKYFCWRSLKIWQTSLPYLGTQGTFRYQDHLLSWKYFM